MPFGFGGMVFAPLAALWVGAGDAPLARGSSWYPICRISAQTYKKYQTLPTPPPDALGGGVCHALYSSLSSPLVGAPLAPRVCPYPYLSLCPSLAPRKVS